MTQFFSPVRTTLVAIAFGALLNACATSNVSINDGLAAPAMTVSAKRVVIEDLTVASAPESPTAWVYRSGWMPVPASWTKPSFSELVLSDLRQGVQANGSASEVVHITVLEVSISQDKIVADDIAFVGLFALGRERPFLCKLTMSLRILDRSKKVVLDAQEVRRRHYSDMDPAEVKNLVAACKGKLIQAAQLKIREFLADN